MHFQLPFCPLYLSLCVCLSVCGDDLTHPHQKAANVTATKVGQPNRLCCCSRCSCCCCCQVASRCCKPATTTLANLGHLGMSRWSRLSLPFSLMPSSSTFCLCLELYIKSLLRCLFTLFLSFYVHFINLLRKTILTIAWKYLCCVLIKFAIALVIS